MSSVAIPFVSSSYDADVSFSHQTTEPTATPTTAAHVTPVAAAAPADVTVEPISRSWLAARLLHGGYDGAVVRDCEQIIVIKEGFVQEGDWLECPPSEFNRAYLTNIGVTGLGLQRHLVKLHSQLRPIYMKSSNPTWQEENNEEV